MDWQLKKIQCIQSYIPSIFGYSLKRRERGRSVKGEHSLGLKKIVQSKLPRVWFELVSLGPFVVLPAEPLLLVLYIFFKD